ncbi:MAG: lipoate protein ligase C-terminal domain-containing protein [Candidatus Hadarchaeota archaeon]|nr:lipoate protein ligase C-terminal domain-containing protein [Candidatus Hadarchaeota archaeon]
MGVSLSYAEFKAPKGVIKVELKLEDDEISEISIGGDFFMYPEDALEKLESSLVGVKTDRETILSKVKEFYDSADVRTPMVEPEHWVEAILRAVEGDR